MDNSKIEKSTFKCTCKGVQPQSYGNQLFVHAPVHMPKSNGYCLDKCIAEEVMLLWHMGITTTGCCCGHHVAAAYIGVIDVDIPRMKELGYQVLPNTSRPQPCYDEDSFSPLGAEHLLTRLFKSAPAPGPGI